MISRFEILSGTDESNRPQNMSASECTHWLLELRWLTDLNPHNNNDINYAQLLFDRLCIQKCPLIKQIIGKNKVKFDHSPDLSQ